MKDPFLNLAIGLPIGLTLLMASMFIGGLVCGDPLTGCISGPILLMLGMGLLVHWMEEPPKWLTDPAGWIEEKQRLRK